MSRGGTSFYPPAGSGDYSEGAPDPSRLVAGAPVLRTWNAYESADGTVFGGVWEATPGAWRVRL